MRESEAHPHVPEERAELFTTPDANSSEDETHGLLEALVRSLKPEAVLETGSFLGWGTAALARGVRANGFGKVVSIEIDQAAAFLAKNRLGELSLDGLVEIVVGDSVEWLRRYSGVPFGFSFLDSSFDARVRELETLAERGLAHGPVMIHDTSRLRTRSVPAETGTHAEFLRRLDELGIPAVENPLSRGWRLLAIPRRGR